MKFNDKTEAETVFSDSPAVQKEKAHNVEEAMQTLTEEQRAEVDAYVEKNAPKPKIMYALWFFTGLIGGHRVYFHDYAPAVLMIIMLFIFPIGDVIWWIVEFFLLKRNVQRRIVQLKAEKLKELEKKTQKMEKAAESH